MPARRREEMMHDGNTSLQKHDVSVCAAWYVVQCKPRQDDRALLHLCNQEIECYRPVITREKLIRGRKRNIQESLFPGYLFVRLDQASAGWGKIRSTRGVSRLISFGGRPAAIDARIFSVIRQSAHDPESALKPLFQPGEWVKIIRGPLRTLDAIFQAYDGECRALLLIELLNQLRVVKLPLTDLAT